MEHVLWLSIIGALLALDFAMFGQFMISQPIVTGTIFGVLFGDVQAGIIVGAMIQLLWTGVLPVGAFIPSDHTVTGGITACLALILITKTGLTVNVATVLALAVAIPAGFLSGKIDILVRHMNSKWNSLTEKGLDNGSIKIVGWANYSGLIAAFFRNFIIYIIWLSLGATGLIALSEQLPDVIKNGLVLAFWLLPTISLAVIIDLILKERLGWWIAGAIIFTAPLVLIWSGHLFYLMLVMMAIGTVIAIGRRTW